MKDKGNLVFTKILQQPKDHKLSLEILETDHTTGIYSVELEITWCKYKEQIAGLEALLAEAKKEVSHWKYEYRNKGGDR